MILAPGIAGQRIVTSVCSRRATAQGKAVCGSMRGVLVRFIDAAEDEERLSSSIGLMPERVYRASNPKSQIYGSVGLDITSVSEA